MTATSSPTLCILPSTIRAMAPCDSRWRAFVRAFPERVRDNAPVGLLEVLDRPQERPHDDIVYARDVWWLMVEVKLREGAASIGGRLLERHNLRLRESWTALPLQSLGGWYAGAVRAAILEIEAEDRAAGRA